MYKWRATGASSSLLVRAHKKAVHLALGFASYILLVAMEFFPLLSM